MKVVIYPGLIWLYVSALFLGTISLVWRGSPMRFFSTLDEQARVREAKRKHDRGEPAFEDESGAKAAS